MVNWRRQEARRGCVMTHKMVNGFEGTISAYLFQKEPSTRILVTNKNVRARNFYY